MLHILVNEDNVLEEILRSALDNMSSLQAQAAVVKSNRMVVFTESPGDGIDHVLPTDGKVMEEILHSVLDRAKSSNA